jgi:DNA-binding MarR family transcriptional regulator
MVRTDPIEDPTPGVERLGNKRDPLPDPRLIRQIIRFRQLRNRFFPEDIFSDPAWDMLLDLTVAHIEHDRVSVTSLCIASGVPPTTALRWIGLMVSNGLFMRYEDSQDRRRSFIALSDRGAQLMADYFSKIPKNSQYII